ncbi:hypothetical protein Lgra_0558 [Legionella gratiana]|uniref:Uncharacterized protein conserved in bacteria n=1 Tax=Legionella gratiana TaxID=45066 RepID=A0A378J4M0_9GAMM|nr:DUF1868 domain-containing protein [Legionella gratiana]KTD14527.1 hypothetical protein Lgra_0558 [Legionella gratiana]STX41931.1 Uncharacterized protein conserved in bacteria [Legionella gratiana]
MFDKIDATGNYIEFPGVTIIAPIIKTSQENAFLHKIHQSLTSSTLLTQYYTPLPYDSYHMTTCNLYTRKEHDRDWFKFITDKLEFFQNLFTQLQIQEFTPEISIAGLETGRALQLRLSLPENQKKMIAELAQAFDIEDRIPPFFHITLAYCYKKIDDEKLHQEILTTLEKIIAPYINQTIKLDVPILCYFESMKAFIPWDGGTYPFNDAPRTKAKRFFEANETPSPRILPEDTVTLSSKLLQ